MTEQDLVVAPDVTLRAATWGDLAGVNRVANAAAVADDTDEFMELEDHEEEWRRTDFDPEVDVLVAVSEDGQVLGWAEAGVASAPRDGSIKAFASGAVDPDWRGRGLGTQLVTWGIARARAKAAELHPGVRVVVSAWGRQADSDAARLLADLGFAPARYFRDMRVALASWEPRPEATVEGVSVRSPEPADAEAVRAAHNEAFADHWGSSEQTEQRWAQMWGKRVFRPELSQIAIDDATGEVLAYVLSEEWVKGEQYVSLVGTRRRARGRHLASLLLGRVLRAGKEAGMEKAELGVDAESPTKANGVYERVGFSVVRTGVAMELSPTAEETDEPP